MPQRIPAGLTRIASVLRFTPVDGGGADGVAGSPWDVAIGSPGWWRTPVATWVAVISGDDGYLLDVAERRVVERFPEVNRIREDELHGQVLMSTGSALFAVGEGGIRWHSQVAGRGDLKVDAVHRDRILLSDHGGPARRIELAVDPETGATL
ncbi:MAG TPA: hypothetical protein VL294_02525 [Pseudolysinimonas sp.]|nr:hypothetical protein [Pseudolysinimonas sp.]